MSDIKTTNPRRLVIFAAVLVIALSVMLIFARDFIRELVVLPLSYLVWVFKVILFIVPQTYFWMAAVAIGLLIAWRAISGRPSTASGSRTPISAAIDSAIAAMAETRSRQIVSRPSLVDRQPPGKPIPVVQVVEAPVEVNRGRAAFWATKITLVRRGASSYYQSTFHVALALLLMEMLAHRYRLTPTQVEERLRLDPNSEQGRLLGLDVPEFVREYVLSRMRYHDLEAKPFWIRLRDIFAEFIRNLSRSLEALLRGPENAPALQPLDPRVERIIKYMEEELEVPNDDNDR